MKRAPAIALVCTSLVLTCVGSASAAGNFGFETGDKTGWSAASDLCGKNLGAEASGRWNVVDTSWLLSPEFGSTSLPVAAEGTRAAFFVQTGPAWGVLYRKLKIPRGSKSLTVSVWWTNQATELISPGSAPRRGDAIPIPVWAKPTNPVAYACKKSGVTPQWGSVDLLRPGAKANSLKGKDILRTLWQPARGITPEASSGWEVKTVSLKGLGGKTVIIRSGVSALQFYLNLGVDRIILCC